MMTSLRDQVRLHIAYLRDAQGDVAQKQDAYGEAEGLYREALTIAEELGEVARPLQGRTHTRLGLLYATQGRRDEARKHLTTAMDLETIEAAMRLTDEVTGIDEELGAGLKWLLAPRASGVKREYALQLLTDALEVFRRLGNGRAQQVWADLEQMQGNRVTW